MSARWKIDVGARDILEEQYKRNRVPSPESKRRLAEELLVTPRRIQR